MKRLLFVVPVLFIFSISLLLAEESPLTARIGAGFVVLNQADNLSGSGTSILSSLDQKPQSTTKLYPLPLLELSYRQHSNEWYLGRMPDEPVAVSAGVRHQREAGLFTLGLFYAFFNDEWQDPYLVGVPRTDTSISHYGVKIGWDKVLDSYFSFNYRGVLKDVDRDLRGEITESLRRDGAAHELTAAWKPRVGRAWALGPSFIYERGEYNGAASRYNCYGAAFELLRRGQRTLFFARVSGRSYEYQEAHPLFARTREEQSVTFSSGFTYFAPFGFQHYYATSGLVATSTMANIDFFDAHSVAALATIGYQF